MSMRNCFTWPKSAASIKDSMLLSTSRQAQTKMAYCFYATVLLPFFLISCAPLFLAQDADPQLPLKAVNIGNWLVVEGWMKPSMFDGIPNKDLLDGSQVQFMSIQLQKYLSLESGVGRVALVNHSSGWETFRLWRINETYFNFRAFNKQFVALSDWGSLLVAVSDPPSYSETFQIIRSDADASLVRIRAPNGLFLQAKSESIVTADYEGSGWEDSNPSVFKITIVGSAIQGEYQITNGYGPDKAPQVMRDHRNSYITEEDFKFMSTNGLNAVRVPVGWWIAHDPTPPKPFVGGSLQALDNAFTWAQKYGMKVIVDLHAIRASQNGNPHSASRDGYQEWGDSDIPETVSVIDFLAKRYANHPSLVAIELMNEPIAPGVTLDSLKKYYKAGYDAVRKYTSSAYVIISNRLGRSDPKELLSFAGNLSRVVIDVHYYNLFSDAFSRMNANQNIDYIYHRRSSDLSIVTRTEGPLSFVGEWSGEWDTNGASTQDYQRFTKAQTDIYGRATFGWAYWAYKCDLNHWSLKWMIENNYIKL